MMEIEYTKKHYRGSSPQHEMDRVMDDWVRGLRSIEYLGYEPMTPAPKIEERRSRKSKLTAQSSDPQTQKDEGRWQDDGGEGG